MYKYNPFTQTFDEVVGYDYYYHTVFNTLATRPNSVSLGSYNFGAAIVNKLYAVPTVIKAPITINAFRVGITTGAVGGLVMGLYKQGTNGLPDTLVCQCPEINTNVSGVYVTSTLPSSVTLPAGVYYLAISTNAALTLASISPDKYEGSILGVETANLQNSYNTILKTSAYNAVMPANFLALTTDRRNETQFPLIAVNII